MSRRYLMRNHCQTNRIQNCMSPSRRRKTSQSHRRNWSWNRRFRWKYCRRRPRSRLVRRPYHRRAHPDLADWKSLSQTMNPKSSPRSRCWSPPVGRNRCRRRRCFPSSTTKRKRWRLWRISGSRPRSGCCCREHHAWHRSQARCPNQMNQTNPRSQMTNRSTAIHAPVPSVCCGPR